MAPAIHSPSLTVTPMHQMQLSVSQQQTRITHIVSMAESQIIHAYSAPWRSGEIYIRSPIHRAARVPKETRTSPTPAAPRLPRFQMMVIPCLSHTHRSHSRDPRLPPEAAPVEITLSHLVSSVCVEGGEGSLCSPPLSSILYSRPARTRSHSLARASTRSHSTSFSSCHWEMDCFRPKILEKRLLRAETPPLPLLRLCRAETPPLRFDSRGLS